jgi:glutamate dehydrogenase
MRQALATSPEFSIERLSKYLLAYFPDALVTEFKDDILNHPLGLDIAHAMFTNAVLGDAGCSWLTEMVTQTGEEPANILTAYIEASNLLSTIALKKAITDVEATLESTIEYLIRLQIEQALERATGWLLRRSIEDYEKFSKTFEKVLSNFHELLPEHDEEARLASAADLQAAGMPENAATDLSRFEHLDEILDVTRLIISSNASPVDAAQAFYLAGDQTGLLKLIRSSEQSYNTSKLEKPARAALRDLLRGHQVGIARRILKAGAQTSESTALLEEIQGALSSVTRGRLDLSTLVISADRVGRYTEG